MIKFFNARRLSALSAAALSLAAFVAPASAAEGAAGKAASTAALVLTASATPERAQPKKYCIVEAETGTRIPRKSCKTEREWLDAGVDLSKH